MRTFSILFISLFTAGFSLAQQRVALHSAGTTTIFSSANPFQDAYTAAVNGDTIYLPGGQFTIPPSFNKQLTVIGTGIHADSTTATGKTIINSPIYFGTGSDKSHFEGLYINSTINFLTNEKVDSVLLRRNYCTGINIPGTTPGTECNALRIEENVIYGSINAQHSTNIIVFNNMLRSLSNIAQNGWIANNIFFYLGSGYPAQSVYYSLFQNNYIQTGWGLSGCQYNTFQNNVWDTDQSIDLNNTHLSEYYNVSTATMFVSFGFANAFETSDYHLNSPATYLGTTGDEVSLYGGYAPIKEGWVPFNPHFRNITVAPTTNASGLLNVQIEVGAQDN